jgi:hypothetical protein
MNSHRDRHETTSVIHVLIANLAGVVVEMLQQTLHHQSDIKLLEAVEGWEEINAAIAETNVLVLGVNDVYAPPEDCFQLLSKQPSLKILLLTTTGDEAIAYWRALHCHPMQVTSSQSLIESIRQLYSLSPF